MVSFSALTLFVAVHTLCLLAPALLVGAVPARSSNMTSNSSRPSSSGSSSGYWLANIKHQGIATFNKDSSYKIFRNVKTDCGAAGDGTTDDITRINDCISNGNRCGGFQGFTPDCNSSTTTPAIIYFPPGKYYVSTPIVQYYYTQLIGDATDPPTIVAAPGFNQNNGGSVIDSDPYISGSGTNWYVNQASDLYNNFFRQIRNFVIDITGVNPSGNILSCIHWQVAQATSLQNIVFNMSPVKGKGNTQQGIGMDNGSGGFMSDLTFNGGNYGAFFGNQQFTTRNLTFNGCNTAIFMNWNWVWTLKSLSINNCNVGIDMSAGSANGGNQTVGSVLLQDSTFSGTPTGILTAYSSNQNLPATGGTLIIDNVDFTGSTTAVASISNTAILAGGSRVASWAQGHSYTTGNDGTGNNATCAAPTATFKSIQQPLTAPSKPATLLDSTGKVFERSKPQYESYDVSQFVSIKDGGAVGDGVTDDTQKIQAVLDGAGSKVVFFDHGAYLVKDTIKVPSNIKIVGEIWPIIMADGASFSDVSNPKAVFQVGSAGDSGAVEISDLVFETYGAAPGAIMIEWNVAESSQGASGMWDTHVRIGGSAGTGLQSDKCPAGGSTVNTACEGAFLMLHVTQKATIYLENTWFWVADHELDLPPPSISSLNQITIYNGRGVLIESSQGPVWMYGTASEHSQMYNYQFANAKNIYVGVMQSETPYYQPSPTADGPFLMNSKYNDPDFSACTTATCKMAWGLRVLDSSSILGYGAGLYSFFDNYSQDCLAGESCQQNMVSLECSSDVYLFGLTTKGSTNMVSVDGTAAVEQAPNLDVFGSTIAFFEEVGS